MRVLSLFTGAGGIDLGLEAAGHQVVGMCEIDPWCRKVLRQHWPDTPIHDDVTTFDPKGWHGRVDLVAGGSPCQDLSVAGRRKGLGGERSGLFWHQCRIADSVAARWVLWENVAGALTSNNGADFAAVLWGFTGALPDVPDGGWRGWGVCVGPKRTAVWRVLDARWFGVPQRRRRVFVVSGPRAECGPEVLFEPEGCGRTHQAGSAPKHEVAGTLAGGSGERGYRGDLDGHGAYVPFTPSSHTSYVQGVGALRAAGGDLGGGSEVLLTYTKGADMEMGEANVYNALRAGNGGLSRQNAVRTTELAVRRLTPRECERLMGWPDDWTRWADDGTEIADSHRYRMCGNGVVAPVAAWIGSRLPT